VPTVTDAEVLCEVVEHGQVGGVVVAHHDPRIGIRDAASGERLRIARGEAVHRAAVDLPIDRRRGVLRIPALVGEVSRAEIVDRIAPATEVVCHPWPQSINLGAATLEREVAEHVIKGAVLQHQHGDVLDPLKAVALSDSHRPPRSLDRRRV
jgi:hypothetical protein